MLTVVIHRNKETSKNGGLFFDCPIDASLLSPVWGKVTHSNHYLEITDELLLKWRFYGLHNYPLKGERIQIADPLGRVILNGRILVECENQLGEFVDPQETLEKVYDLEYQKLRILHKKYGNL